MADRYWVGGTAAWDGTAGTKWALTSGGAGGEAVPTSADDVFFSSSSTGTCTISTGNTGAKSINCTGFTGTLAGTDAISVSGSVTLVTGMTVTYTGTLSLIATGTITSAGKTLGGITVNGSGITVTLGDALTTGTSNTTTLTAGTLALAGFTLTTGSFSSSNSNTRAISFGSGNIALSSTTAATTILSMATATGFTWTGTGGFTRNQAATATVQFGSTSGGTVSNAPNLTVNAGSSTLTITTGSYLKNVNLTGSSVNLSGAYNACGDITASSTSFPSVNLTFLASATITSNGRSFLGTTISGSGITVTLADAFTIFSNQDLTLTQGTFDAANFNVTVYNFVSSNSNTRTLNMGSGTWTIQNNWLTTTSTNLTLNAGTSTIRMINASFPKTFSGGGKTYYNLVSGSDRVLSIVGSNTFNNITNTAQPTTVTFAAGTTQTVSNFGLAGTSGNLVTIDSDTPGSRFTLSKASGTVNADFLSIKDSNATGGATWNALASCVNGGNNIGWIFPTVPGNMFLMFV